MKIKLILIVIISCLASLLLSASPGEHYWENEILLGENSSDFYVLKNCRYNPGTHYHYIDSIYLIERNKISGQIKDKILLRVIESTDTSTYGDWFHDELYTNSFDLTHYQKTKTIQPIFKDEFNEYCLLTDVGIIISYEKSEKLLMGLWRLGRFSEWIPQYIKTYGVECCDEVNVRITDFYSSNDFIYISIDNNKNQWDMNCFHSFIPISKKFFNDACNGIRGY